MVLVEWSDNRPQSINAEDLLAATTDRRNAAGRGSQSARSAAGQESTAAQLSSPQSETQAPNRRLHMIDLSTSASEFEASRQPAAISEQTFTNDQCNDAALRKGEGLVACEQRRVLAAASSAGKIVDRSADMLQATTALMSESLKAAKNSEKGDTHTSSDQSSGARAAEDGQMGASAVRQVAMASQSAMWSCRWSSASANRRLKVIGKMGLDCWLQASGFLMALWSIAFA